MCRGYGVYRYSGSLATIQVIWNKTEVSAWDIPSETRAQHRSSS